MNRIAFAVVAASIFALAPAGAASVNFYQLPPSAPFWKKTERASGAAWVDAGAAWVDAKTTDQTAADRWKNPNRDAAE